MPSYNRLVLMGHMVRDPELQTSSSKVDYVKFMIAVEDWRAGADGKDKKPHFFRVTAFGAVAQNIHRFFRKGQPILIEGRILQKEWQDKDGNKREAIEIVAERWSFTERLTSGDRIVKETPGPDSPAPDSDAIDVPF